MPAPKKLPVGDIERICLGAVQALPGLETTSEIRIGPLTDSSQFTWKLISITPVPDPVAYDTALGALRPLQGEYELLDRRR